MIFVLTNTQLNRLIWKTNQILLICIIINAAEIKINLRIKDPKRRIVLRSKMLFFRTYADISRRTNYVSKMFWFLKYNCNTQAIANFDDSVPRSLHLISSQFQVFWLTLNYAVNCRGYQETTTLPSAWLRISHCIIVNLFF